MKNVTRTRLVWFTAGFTVSGALISNYIRRDYLRKKNSILTEMEQKCEELKARVSSLEASSRTNAEMSSGSD